jgi:cytochrome c-type biogenesis protein CcmE
MTKNSKVLPLAALALLAGGMACLFATGLSAGRVLHLQVSEVLLLPLEKTQAIRVTGIVGRIDAFALNGQQEIGFQLQDHEFPEKSLWAVYSGERPDLFLPGAPVIVEGVFPGSGRAFQALKLTTLCPSRYEEKALAVRQG